MRVSAANEFIFAHPIPTHTFGLGTLLGMQIKRCTLCYVQYVHPPEILNNDKQVSGFIQGMELFKEYQSFDHHTTSRPRSTPTHKVANHDGKIPH